MYLFIWRYTRVILDGETMCISVARFKTGFTQSEKDAPSDTQFCVFANSCAIVVRSDSLRLRETLPELS